MAHNLDHEFADWQQQNPEGVEEEPLSPVLGVGPTTTSTNPGTPHTEGGIHERSGGVPFTETTTETFRVDDVLVAIQEMPTLDQGWLALDMYFNVPGAYGANPEDIYLEDGITLDPMNFRDALTQTLNTATAAGPEGFNLTPMFLDILQRKNMSPAELKAALATRQAEIAAGNSPKGTSRGHYDSAGLVKAAHAGASSTLGRKATKAEAAKFVKEIHNMQASGASSMDIGALSEEAARRDAPVEAAAMDHVGAAGLLFQAIGGGR